MTVLVIGKIVNGVKITKFVENGEIITERSKVVFCEKSEVVVSEIPKVVKETSLAEKLQNRASLIEVKKDNGLDIPNFMKERSKRLEHDKLIQKQIQNDKKDKNKVVRFPKHA